MPTKTKSTAAKKRTTKKSAAKKSATKKLSAKPTVKRSMAKRAMSKRTSSTTSRTRSKAPKVRAKSDTRRPATKTSGDSKKSGKSRVRARRKPSVQGTREATLQLKPTLVFSNTELEPSEPLPSVESSRASRTTEDLHMHSKPEVQIMRHHLQALRGPDRRPTVRGH